MSLKENQVTELVTTESKTVTNYTAPPAGWNSDGNEDIQPAFPTVSIVQPMTQIEKAIPGWFYHSDTEEQTGDFDGVFLLRRETRAMFVNDDENPVCRSDNGKVPAPRQRLWNMEAGARIGINKQTYGVPPIAPKDCANCVFSDWGDGVPPLCANQYVIIAARNGDPDDLVQVRLKGTSIKPFRQWVAKKLAPKGLGMYFFQVHLETEERTEPTKKWHQVVISSSQMTERDALVFNDILTLHRARIEHTVKEAGAEVEGWADDGNEFVPFE